MPCIVKVQKKSPLIELPRYETKGAAGMDIRAFLTGPVTILPMGRALIPTGLIFEIPPGYEAQVRPRSGLAYRNGIILPNAPGTIDRDYRGEVSVILINAGQEPFIINNGDRIAQLVFAPVAEAILEETAAVSETARGSGGFGSTGT
jgi:dUTP pyrophosphatase